MSSHRRGRSGSNGRCRNSGSRTKASTSAELIGSDELRKIHPQAKLPAITDDGRALFESSAICNWLADSHPEKELIAKSGTWERAQHDQWCGFIMTELEAHLWTMGATRFSIPKNMRSKEAVEQARMEAARRREPQRPSRRQRLFRRQTGLPWPIFSAALPPTGPKSNRLAEDAPNVTAFNARIKARPHCALNDA